MTCSRKISGYLLACVITVLIVSEYASGHSKQGIYELPSANKQLKSSPVFNESVIEISELWENILKVFQELHVEKDFLKYMKQFLSGDITQQLPYDPDALRNASQLIASKGFLSEEYHVTTADGYILLLLRIKPAKAVKRDLARLPVFLLHGLLSSCDCYINNLRNESLAFILVDLGYDVWLGNVRGSRYSTRHQNLQPNQKDFWKWSFDEMGKYDVPVMVDFVLSNTGYKKLDFVGHSEGTTNLITSVIVNGEEMSQKINKFIALAPAVFISNTKSIMRYLAKSARIIKKTWDFFNEGDFFAHDGILGKIGQRYCYDIPDACWDIIEAMVGPGMTHSNQSRIPVYLSHAPAGTSTQNMMHWAQLIEGGDSFNYYDYGSKWENFLHYHQFSPPTYDLRKFTVPTYAFLGSIDWMVVPQDGNATVHKLPNIKWVNMYQNYTHIDFVWGFNVAKTAFKDVIRILSL